MGAVAGPLVAAGFVTPVKRAMGTTLASTALTALHGENGPAPLLSRRGVTAIARPPLANSAVHSFDSVPVGSHGNFLALGLRYYYFCLSNRVLQVPVFRCVLQLCVPKDQFLSLRP